jgi:hypothetical protein
VADQDIRFKSNAVIDGDTYGYGLFPTTSPAIDDPKNFGGVIIDNSSQVTFNGNIYSRSYVQLAATSNGSASLTVNNGLIYANSMVLQSGAQGKMIVNGSVYTFDDLELNGTGGEIKINGSYYGYTDGSTTGLSHDKSSAIVINADMDAGSKLTIEGAYTSVTSSKSTIDYLESSEGILIGGTAYVDVQPTRYQTAESVSVRGNFVAYTWGFDQDTVDLMKTAGDNIFNKTPYNFYDSLPAATYDTRVDAKLLKDNITWLGIASSTITLANGSSTGEYELKDRKAYFIAFKKYVDADSNTFIKGGNIAPGNRSISLQNYIYTTGLKLVYDTTSGENEFLDLSYKSGTNTNKVGQPEYNALSGKILDDHIYQLQMMDYRNGIDITPLRAAEESAPMVEVPLTYYNVNAVKKYTKIDTITTGLPYYDSKIIPSILNIAESAQDITYVNNATGTPLHIYGKGTSGSGTPSITITEDNSQGIIVHNGDIIIHGDLKFVGPIISNGTITTDGGSQQFINNTTEIRNYLAKKIYGDNVLYDLFNVIDRGGPGTPGVSLSKIEFVEFDKSKTLDQSNNSKYNYSDLMNFEHWKVEK